MDVWAYCASCARWYFVPSSTIEALCEERCPVCDTKPDRYEDRGRGWHFEVVPEGAHL